MRLIKHTTRYCTISLGGIASIAAPSSIAGTIGLGAVSGVGDYFSAKSLQNDSQSFTKQMMRNKHQWQVQDLKAAGLNPILSAGGGAPMGGSGIASAGNPVSKGISTALAAQLLQKQIQKIDAEINNIGADTNVKDNVSSISDLPASLAQQALGFIDNRAAEFSSAVDNIKRAPGLAYDLFKAKRFESSSRSRLNKARPGPNEPARIKSLRQRYPYLNNSEIYEVYRRYPHNPQRPRK